MSGVPGMPVEAVHLSAIRARQEARRVNRPEPYQHTMAMRDVDFLLAKVDELSSTLTAISSLREVIAAEVLAPVRAAVEDRGRVARNLQLLIDGAAGKHCVVCDHVRHNELAYCQISGCVCSTGTSVNSTARVILRDLRAALSAPVQAAEPVQHVSILRDLIEVAHEEQRQTVSQGRDHEALTLFQHWSATAGWLSSRVRAYERGDDPDMPDAMHVQTSGATS